MNKYQEAYEIVDTILHLMCGERREDGYEPTMDELLQAMSSFKELVDKSTPTKPVYIYPDEPICPYCREPLDFYCEHCDICDQRIDWSEDEKRDIRKG